MTVKSTGTWVLPQPLDVQEDNEWIALPRIGRTVPFGYEVDKNNDRVLRPIKLELDLLEKAKKHLKVYSYREVANWLSTQSARYISHVGLMKRVKDERRRKNKAKSLRNWAAYVEKALAEAEALEKERLDHKAG